MANLLYKTRGNMSPQGKPRVFFACHGEDFHGYFQEITDEILKISDCAVFYYEPGEVALDEDYYLNLGQMQLLVMPVTTRLLYTKNRAMDVEFAYAAEHHIPVLPLMQEAGLESRYHEKFGDLQFLDKHNGDPTAIPYAEKLNRYLQAVLVGDELAEKVRAAFDAYIFLSYRKKDRKFAQELMQLIHRSPLCRNIAIWYDEFLTPGEDFNDAIRAALEKSSLFVLAVTPNLVNETNYVMTTEYPMAKDAGKPILPAEMAPTDPETLRKSYDGIPSSVDPRDQEALLSRLRALALRENDRDPQHNFFIGLAYLSGIDVEVDHDYAVKLITSAAESGLTEAMEKLVHMYETGEGVKRDYMTAISWSEKLVAQAKSEYERYQTESCATRYFLCLRRLGAQWSDLADLLSAKKVYETMYSFSQERVNATSSKTDIRCLSISYSKLGGICADEHDYAGAKQWYEKSLELEEKLEEQGVPDARRCISIRYVKLGNICELELDPDGAKLWYTKALKMIQETAAKGTVSDLRDLAYVYSNMGDICSYMRSSGHQMNLEEAKQWYLKALEIRQRLSEDGTADSQRELAGSYYAIGRICRLRGDVSGAKHWYTKALELEKKLAESDKATDLRDFADVCSKLSLVYREEGDLEKNKELTIMALEIRQRLAQTDTVQALEELSLSYGILSGYCEDAGDLAGAKQWGIQAAEIHQRLIIKGIKESQRRLDTCCDRLGRICKAMNELTEAKYWYGKSLEFRQKTAETGTLADWTMLSDVLEKMGGICRDEGNVTEARRWHYKSQRARSIGYKKQGDNCRAEGDLPEAKKWYLKSVEIRERLAKTGAAQARRDLSITCIGLGDTFMDEGDRSSAKQWYERALELGQRLAEENDTHGSKDDLAFCYYKLGRLLEDTGMLEKALTIWRTLAQARSDVPRYAKNAAITEKQIVRLKKNT